MELATLWAKFQGIYQMATDDPNLGAIESTATELFTEVCAT